MVLEKDVVVMGGGAAGLMCAIEAGRRGRSVVLLEHAEKIGKKILISGGGRCNFTNLHARPECYLSANPHFHRSALVRYQPKDFVALVDKHRVPYHEKKLGQLFCDDSSRRIVGLLLEEAAQAGVEIRVETPVRHVERGTSFRVSAGDTTYAASSVVVATGGLSIPKMGATDFAHRLARLFDLRLVQPRPGLVPFTLPPERLRDFGNLSGVSIDVSLTSGDVSFRENLLFTHRGLSGPAILQISSYWHPGEAISVDLLPAMTDRQLSDSLRSGTKTGNWLCQHLPKRFVEAWLPRDVAEVPTAQLSRAQVDTLIGSLRSWQVVPSGTEGYSKAEVTVGGVDTGVLSSKTMEVRHVPGLFFVGEAVDVTGWLGGYNFQWAWASGWVAGQFA